MKDIKKRGLLMIVSLVLLLGIGIYMTYAWYTRITGVSAIEFTAARWDFNANYQADSLKVNVFEYESVYGGNIAAPGTAGTVNLRLGADESDVDVQYVLMVDPETMSEEFQKRIFFWYLDENGEEVEFEYGVNGINGEISARSSSIVEFYWKWVYDYDGYLERTDKEKYVAASGILRTVYDSPIGGFTTMDNFCKLYDYMVGSASVIGSTPVNPEDSGSICYKITSGALDYEELWNARLADDAYNALNVIINMSAQDRGILFDDEANYGGSSSGILTGEEIQILAKYRNANSSDPACLQTLFTENYGTDDLKAKYGILEILRDFSPAQRNLFFENTVYLDKCFGLINISVKGENYATSAAYLTHYITETAHFSSYEDFFEAYLAEYEEFDSFDNKVGSNPKYYESQMTATVYIVGTQVRPEAVAG